MFQLFVCDWEGCVAEPGGGTVPFDTGAIWELSQQIQKMKNTPGAPAFVLCSGRQFPYGEAALQMLGAFWDERPSIFENGAGLYFPTTKRVLTNPAITGDVKKWLPRAKDSALEFLEKHGGERELGKEWTISLNPPVEQSIESYFERASEHFAPLLEYGIIEMTHSKSAVDITPRGVNKGSALEFLAEVTQISPTSMVGIGDTAGDLPMLQRVGHPACPQNADENIRALCEYVSPQRTTRGVIDIVRHYVED
jgi:HAD superfamily hydrolase (TIGR01484 family)